MMNYDKSTRANEDAWHIFHASNFDQYSITSKHKNSQLVAVKY